METFSAILKWITSPGETYNWFANLAILSVAGVLSVLVYSIRWNVKFLRSAAHNEVVENRASHQAHTKAIAALQNTDMELCKMVERLTIRMDNRDREHDEIIRTLKEISVTMQSMQKELGEKVSLDTCLQMQRHGHQT